LPIGQGADYYDGIDREGEKQQKLMIEVYEWWESLDDEEQFKVMMDWYPMEITKDTDIDKFFGDMGSKKQLHIWKDENGYSEGIRV